MTVGGHHHGNFDALGTESGNPPGPLSFDKGPPFQPETQFSEEFDRGIEILHHDADIIHPLNSHTPSQFLPDHGRPFTLFFHASLTPLFTSSFTLSFTPSFTFSFTSSSRCPSRHRHAVLHVVLIV